MSHEDNIFTRNHLHKIVANESDLRSYLIHALHIDVRFVALFDAVALKECLAQVLCVKPIDVPTEVYLKSQQWWLVHKLLLRLGLQEKLWVLLHDGFLVSQQQPVQVSTARKAFAVWIGRVRQSLFDFGQPLYSLVQEMETGLEQMKSHYTETLHEEQVVYTQHRRAVVQWLYHLLVQEEGEQALVLQVATNEQLINGFHHWWNTIQKNGK